MKWVVRILIMFLIAFLIFVSGGTAFHQPENDVSGNDSLISPDYISKHISYNKKFSFIDYQHNFIQWKWYSSVVGIFNHLKHSDKKQVRVLHIGDSHVQADIVTGAIRNKLQDVFGNGGRGLIFPYSCAGTHPGYDYHTYSRGYWEYSRNTKKKPGFSIGVSGATVRTKDRNASFKILFNTFHRPNDNRVLKIFCNQGSKSFDLMLKLNNNKSLISIDCSDTLKPYILVPLPESPQSLEFFINKSSSEQKYFECYGLSLENSSESGILYHSVGINGASFNHILQQDLMEKHLSALDPHLVVIDLGGNDYYVGGLNHEEYNTRLTEIVKKIKSELPLCSILISCSQDIYRYRRYSIADCKPAAQIAADVAFKNGCAFFDYYRVSGGRYSMSKWHSYQLAKHDKVHLTFDGYQIKGEIVSNALLGSYYHFLNGHFESPISTDSIGLPSFEIPEQKLLASRTSNTNLPTSSNGKQIYKIRYGDNLGKIAQMFNVSIRDLQRWNNLSGSFIKSGQNLVIYSNVQTSSTEKKQTQTKSKVKATTLYVVKKGDTLWKISNRYNTSVDQIKNANHLKSDHLKIGQTLIIN